LRLAIIARATSADQSRLIPKTRPATARADLGSAQVVGTGQQVDDELANAIERTVAQLDDFVSVATVLMKRGQQQFAAGQFRDAGLVVIRFAERNSFADELDRRLCSANITATSNTRRLPVRQ
jgi:Tfp pilus assembly protein PilF